MAADYTLTQNDLLPIIGGTCKDAAGAAVSLTGATVKFIMRAAQKVSGKFEPTSAAAKINAVATPDADQTANKGKVTYTWAGTDTDTPGFYVAEWEVTFASTKKTTFPTGYFVIEIKDDLG